MTTKAIKAAPTANGTGSPFFMSNSHSEANQESKKSRINQSNVESRTVNESKKRLTRTQFGRVWVAESIDFEVAELNRDFRSVVRLDNEIEALIGQTEERVIGRHVEECSIPRSVVLSLVRSFRVIFPDDIDFGQRVRFVRLVQYERQRHVRATVGIESQRNFRISELAFLLVQRSQIVQRQFVWLDLRHDRARHLQFGLEFADDFVLVAIFKLKLDLRVGGHRNRRWWNRSQCSGRRRCWWCGGWCLGRRSHCSCRGIRFVGRAYQA